MRLQKVTYLGNVWNYLGQGQNCDLTNINWFKLKSSLIKITHMIMKIAVSPEYDYEKRLFHSNRLILILLQKELTALKLHTL